MTRRFLTFAFLTSFVLIGIGVMCWGAVTISRAHASLSWPTAKGVITISQIGQHSGKNSTTYSADVGYTFKVGTAQYHGSRIRFGSWSGSYAAASAELHNYPLGASVVVHYDASDANRNVLEPGVRFGCWGIVLFGFVFALFGSGFMGILEMGSDLKVHQAAALTDRDRRRCALSCARQP